MLASELLFYLVILRNSKLAKVSGQQSNDNTMKFMMVCLLSVGFALAKINAKFK